MKRPASIPPIVVFVLAALAGRAGAWTARIESLDWMVADSAIVVLGNVDMVEESRPSPYAPVRATARVIETIKGPKADTVEFLAPSNIAQGQRLLLFLVPRDKPGENRWNEFPSCKLMVRQLQSNVSVIAEGTPAANLPCGRDLQPLTSFEAVMAAARAAAAKQAPREANGVWLPGWLLAPPARSYSDFGEKANIDVIVPADDELEAIGRLWTGQNDSLRRLYSVRILQWHCSRENVAALRRLLSDNYFSVAGSGKWQERHYDIRADAAKALASWGEDISAAILIDPSVPHHPARLPWPWLLLLPLPPVAMWGLARWRRADAYSSFPLQRPIGTGLALLSLLLCAGVSLLTARSGLRVEEWVWAGGGVNHEIALFRGGVQYMRLDGWSIDTPLSVGGLARFRSDAYWSIDSYQPTERWGQLGFTLAAGRTPGLAGQTHNYHLYRLPFWPLLVGLGIAPVLWLGRYARYRRRRKRGLCVVCGYDLRATPQRCPECGRPVTRPARAHL